MTHRDSPLRDLERPARRAASHPWIEKLARIGYAAKGIVYFVVGLLAARAAFTTGGKTTDASGALATILYRPFGKFLLFLVAIGLFGYVLHCIVQTVFDPERSSGGKNARRLARRLGYGFSALVYSGLGLTAVKLIAGSGDTGGDTTRDWTARAMAQPFGRWLVGFAGLVVIGVGISYLYSAYKAKFQRHLKQHRMGEAERRWAKGLGRFGIAARGFVFAIIGVFLCFAALHADPNEARGSGETLAVLGARPFGPWILGTVASGFIAYSIYCAIEARYRRIVPPRSNGTGS
jgi:hypothetical protein